MTVDPVVADRIRKVCAGLLATSISVLLLRVLGRLAHGHGRWLDPELLALVVLVGLGVAWVRAAKRVRRPPPGPGPP